MDGTALIAILAFGTLGIGLYIAHRIKRATDLRRDNPDAPKSTLAEDAPNTRNR